MAQVVIESPILNSPFEEPRRHFRFDEEGITNEVVEGRRISSYFVPIPQPVNFDGKWRDFFRVIWLLLHNYALTTFGM